jgi:hypothetical protein
MATSAVMAPSGSQDSAAHSISSANSLIRSGEEAITLLRAKMAMPVATWKWWEIHAIRIVTEELAIELLVPGERAVETVLNSLEQGERLLYYHSL